MRAQKAEVAEGSVDFTAVLDAMTTPDAAPAITDLPLANVETGGMALTAKPAKGGNGTGKILPLSVPKTAAALPAAENTDQPPAVAAETDDREPPATAMQAMPEPASALIALMPVSSPLAASHAAVSNAAAVVTRPQPQPQPLPMMEPAVVATPSPPPPATRDMSFPGFAILSAATPAIAPAMPAAAGIAVTVRAAAEPAALSPAAPVPLLAVPPADPKPITQPAQALAAITTVAEPAAPRPRTTTRAPTSERPGAPVGTVQPAIPLADIAANLAVPTVPAAAPVRDSAPHDIAAVVDRLAAARDALAPAAATLAIDHAEFGELSLRFDQKADGGLSVQVAAATPEAHRAISQAVSADGGQTMGGQTMGGQGQQPQSQPAPQPQPAQATTAGQPSPAASERDARGGQPAPRQDPQPGRQPARSDSGRTTSSGEDDGIFA